MLREPADEREASPLGLVEIPPGRLSSSLDPVAIGDDDAQDMRNVDVSRGAWELGQRYRLPQSGLASGLAMGLLRSDAKARLVTLQGGRPYWAALSPEASVLARTGGTAGQQGPLLADALALGQGWTCWPYRGSLFFASGDDAASVFYAQLGSDGLTPVWATLYRDYDPAANVAVSLDRPAYPELAWTTGLDTVARVSGGNDSFGQPTIQNDGQIFMSWPSDPDGFKDLPFCFMVTLGQNGGKIDLLGVDYIGVRVSAKSVRVSGSPSAYRLWLGAPGQAVSAFAEVTVKRIVKYDDAGGVPGYGYLWFDLSGIPRAARAQIDRVKFRGQLYTNGKDGAYVSPFVLGGVYLNAYGAKTDIATEPLTDDVAYGVRYWRPNNGGEATGIQEIALAGDVALGERTYESLPKAGGWGKIVAKRLVGVPFGDGAAGAAGTKVQFFRKVGGLWYKLGEADNAGTDGAGNVPTWIDRLSANDVKRLGGGFVATPGKFDATISGAVVRVVCGCAWKGANCYFDLDGRGYISRTENYKDVPWNGVVKPVRAGDVAAGRAFDVADTLDPVIAAVGGDVLWMATRRELYAMAGARPFDADPAFKVSGVRGAVSSGSIALFEGGAALGSDDGLYHVALARPLAGVAANLVTEELTKGVRRHWAWLLGSEPERLLVRTALGEIRCVCGSRELRRTKDGLWLPSEYAHRFAALVADPVLGAVGLTEEGAVAHFGDYRTDGGSDAHGEGGAPVSWWWRSKRLTEYAAPQGASAYYDTALDSPLVEVEAETELGSGAARFDGGRKPWYRAFRKAVQALGGRWTEIVVRGSGADRVRRVTLHVARGTERR